MSDVDDPILDQAPIAGRSLDIELGTDLVSVDLDILDPDPNDIMDLLKEADSGVLVWTRVADEYWRKGMKEGADMIVQTAKSFLSERSAASLWPLHAFEANKDLFEARTAPKFILPAARRDVITAGTPDKEHHYKAMAGSLNQTDAGMEEAGGDETFQTLTGLTRSLYQLSKKSPDDALQGFEVVLSSKPTNIPALLGKARIHFAKREHQRALHTFSKVLSLSPYCKPDPRIGIGLCYWVMGNHEKARAAWQRSIEVNPDEWASHAMLGIDYINQSKDLSKPDEERASAYATGSKHVQRSFRSNNKGAAAANALSEIFFRKGDMTNALKLAERTVQYADTLTLLSEGNFRVARVYHSEGNTALASRHYQQAAEGQQRHTLASLGLAQMHLKSSEVAAAIHRLDGLTSASNLKSNCLEANIMLASLRTNPRPGVSSADIANDKKKSREMFDFIVKTIDNNEAQLNDGKFSRSIRSLGDDRDMWVEIARLWQQESQEKTERALKEALRISQSAGQTDPRVISNLAALRHLEGDLELARTMYEDSLASISNSSDLQLEEVSTTILYNLARVYEAQEHNDLAKEAYTKLLSRHPEYVDARIRQAQMLKNVNEIDQANELLLQSLTSHSNNLNLRAFYTFFLCQSNQIKLAKDVVFTTLRDHDKHDFYALCAAGYILYQQARESRDNTSEGVKGRRRNFERAVEFYEKALMLDPTCAVAAQGLAIVSADDALGALSGIATAEDSQRRSQNTREALDVFAKVRETLNDGSVYTNMGHCYYARDEFERALESYETASKKFYGQRNIPVLLCLSRTNYAKSNKDQSYSQMALALEYAQRALHLNPSDKSIVYNIAMIEQKAAEIVFSLDASKRTLIQVRKAIEHAEHAQSMFGSLASDASAFLPYDRGIADQRRKYGESILRRADEHLASQETHEQEVQQKLEAARRRRMDEKERLEAIERERARELQAQAEELAMKRKIAREEALAWSNAVKAESDEEREKKKRPRKVKAEGDGGSGDDAEVKKRKRGRPRKEVPVNGNSNMEVPPDEEEAVFSGAEDDKPKKRNVKKRVVRDEDEEDTGVPRKKQIKSKETISDSDDNMD